ncbi:MAG: SpoIIE family protein phosphatase [Thermodesulfobacteriota bacterium]
MPLVPHTLQQRLALYVLLPVAAILAAAGFGTFFYARDVLLDQWREATVLHLERSTHQVDMRLARVKDLITLFEGAASRPQSRPVQEAILGQLRSLPGVAAVHLTWCPGPTPDAASADAESLAACPVPAVRRQDLAVQFTPHRHGQVVGSPAIDDVSQHETVGVVAELVDQNGEGRGRLEVLVRFDHLMEAVVSSGWWQHSRAFLVDTGGRILTCTEGPGRSALAETGDPLEETVLKALQEEASGTVAGAGHPPEEVSAFHRLQEAPWTLVVFAPGRTVLAPIIGFRLYFGLAGLATILVIVAVIRLATARPAAAIRAVAQAAAGIAQGQFGPPLATTGHDEVAELVGRFNTMAVQLAERLRLKAGMDLAMEVQQSLLPERCLACDGLDVAGRSLYCEQTGGDYYDFLALAGPFGPRATIAVGDVTGHGIAAALLMTTARALIRARAVSSDRPGVLVDAVNRLLCLDTEPSGTFMTLFVASFCPETAEILWVRAGHEPASIYDPVTDRFEELRGEGLALGVRPDWTASEGSFRPWRPGQLLVVGTDGVWEATNPAGEAFGKERLQDLIRQHHAEPAARIVGAVMAALVAFHGSRPFQDDATLVVARLGPRPPDPAPAP